MKALFSALFMPDEYESTEVNSVIESAESDDEFGDEVDGTEGDD